MSPKHPHPLELLSPAGDWERLVAAIDYGANAVYLALERFGMRAAATNFTPEQLVKAVDYAHQKNVSVYLTCNTLPQNHELPLFPEFLGHAVTAGVDACVVGDLGVLMLVRQHAPQMPIHISTQMGVMNYQTARAFYELGASRIVLAREVSIPEIREIRANIPADMEIEAFVHGAMCMSISGRCLISDYMTGRSANRGACAQPCRWEYQIVEPSKPDQAYTLTQDETGSYLFNAQDLCMIHHLDQLAAAGVSSFKIEGRAKSVYYVAVITNAYRLALDCYQQDPAQFAEKLPAWVAEEVNKVSHRRYSTGFYLPEAPPTQHHADGGYERLYDVVAVVRECQDGVVYCTQKNKCYEGDTVELLSPGKPFVTQTLRQLQDEAGQEIASTPHAQMLFSFRADSDLQLPTGTLIRKQVTGS